MTDQARISINTLSLAPAALAIQIEQLVAIGAGAISPTIHQLGERGAAETARQIRDAGLGVGTLTHLAFGYATPDATVSARARLDATIAGAEAIGAETITFTSGGRGTLGWREAAARFAEAIRPCAHRAREAGVKLALEPTSHLYSDVSIAHRLTDAASLARGAGIHVGIDLFACWTDSDIEEAIAACAPLTALVQVSDYVFGDRGLPCRAVPGDGAVPLGRLIPLIEAGGFRGFYDLEIIGPRLQNENLGSGLRRAINHITPLLSP